MAYVLSPTQAQIQTALRSFLLSVLPSGIVVVAGQVNRVPEPAGTDFVVFWTIRRDRLQTNIDSYVDVAFTGAIAVAVLTVSAVKFGTIGLGHTLFGVGVTPGTVIQSQTNGTPGGIGIYAVNNSQTVAAETMAAGVANVMQATEITFQLDVHGPNSHDNAQIISTLFRDEYAAEQFATSGLDISPLYADDPHQVPFFNESQQLETRYVIDARIQANQAVLGIPQQFADVVIVEIIEADAPGA